MAERVTLSNMRSHGAECEADKLMEAYGNEAYSVAWENTQAARDLGQSGE